MYFSIYILQYLSRYHCIRKVPWRYHSRYSKRNSNCHHFFCISGAWNRLKIIQKRMLTFSTSMHFVIWPFTNCTNHITKNEAIHRNIQLLTSPQFLFASSPNHSRKFAPNPTSPFASFIGFPISNVRIFANSSIFCRHKAHHFLSKMLRSFAVVLRHVLNAYLKNKKILHLFRIQGN